MLFKRKSKRRQTEPESSLARDLKATRQSGIRTAILVTMLVSGVVPAICMMFRSNDSAVPFSEYLYQMWLIAVLTYPMTIVVALLTVLKKQKLLTFSNLFLTISIVIFCGAIGHAIGFYGGHRVAHTTEQSSSNLQQAHSSEGANANQIQIAGFQNTEANNSLAHHNLGRRNIGQRSQAAVSFGYPTDFGSHQSAGPNAQAVSVEYPRQIQPQSWNHQNGSVLGAPLNTPQATSQTPSPYRMASAQIQQPLQEPIGQAQPKRGLLLGLPASFFGFFLGYYRTYGLRIFLASLLVGMFAGNTANRFLDHLPKNRSETVSLAGDILKERRQLQ